MAVPVRVNFVQGALWTGAAGINYASPPQAITAGNALVVCIGFFNHPGTVVSVTDTAGHTYSKVAHVYNPGDQYRQEIWVTSNIHANAANVVTATFSIAVGFRGIVVMQYSGLDLITPLDDTDQYVGNAPHTTPSLTGTTADAVHVLMSRWGFGTTVFPDGFVKFTTAGAGGPEVADRIVTGSQFLGAYTVTSANYFVIAALFKGYVAPPEPPVPGFVIKVNGTGRNAYTRYRTLRIQKDGAFEQARIEFLDQDISAGAWRPVDGDELHITQDGALEYGGEVVSVTDQRLDGGRGGGTVTVVESRGWMFEADDIIVTVSFPAQGLLDTVQAIFTTYLAAKGWTNNGAPSGGPALPALRYVRQSIRAIFDDLQKRSGWPWRVNGDRFGGFHLPGSLLTPVNFSDSGTSIVLRGMNWKRDRIRHASRLYVTTGGTGEIAYTDSMVGNGAIRVFPVRVEPKDQTPPTEVIEGGVTHAIGAGRWTFRADDPAIIAATPPGNGVAVSVAFQVVYPATVRVWDPPVQLASGDWNYAAVRDAVIQASDQTDIAQALTWAAAELANRLASPKEVSLSTYVQGFYPWQRAILTFPNRLINGAYMVQSTTLTDTGRKDQKPRIDITLLEGDAIGRDWTAYFRERAGTSGGGGSVITGGAGGGSTPGTGGVGLPPGTTFRLAGDNETAYAYPPPPSWRDGPQAVPTQLGGPGMAGAWMLRVPAFLLTPGLLTIRLFDMTTGAALATVQTSHVGTLLSNDFEYLSVNFEAPAAVHDLLLQAQSASGVLDAVIGQTTIVKT